MRTSHVPDPGGRRDRLGYALAVLAGAAGLLVLHYPTILSGLGRVQVDLGDTRLINYFLEHNYLWYLGAPGHERLWDPPFFYPARNVAAYSDTMLGVTPLYAVFRAAGFPPDTAFQLWTIALSVLNYAVMLHFLTRRVGLSVAAASAGAFLFAFGSPRANMLGQQTQLTQFLSLVSVDALYGLFAGGLRSGPARGAAWGVAVAGMLAQLSSAYYPGWFMVLATGIMALLAGAMPATRRAFLATLSRDAPWIVLAAAVGALAMRPWLEHHLAAARELGPRWVPWVWAAMPKPGSWLDTGPDNWLGGWIAGTTGLRGFRSDTHAIPLGIGLATTAAVLAGLYLARGRTSTRLFAVAAGVLALCLTPLPPDLVLAAKVLLIAWPSACAYVERKERPWTFASVVATVPLLLCLRVLPNHFRLGCGLFALVIAAAAFVGRDDDDRRGCLAPGALILILSWVLFRSPLVIGFAAVCGGLSGGVVALWGRRPRQWVEASALAGFIVAAGLPTLEKWPFAWISVVAVPLAVLVARSVPVRPPARALLPLALAGVAAEMVFDYGSAWMFFYRNVPGASSMVFVARVGLILLIPAAIGLGYAVDALRARGRPALALGLGLLVVLEQGTSTRAYDKAANRARIASLARRIDGVSEAFYYTPDGSSSPLVANLDAMWAGAAGGKPTVNGYSGHTPHGWRDLNVPTDLTPEELEKLVVALNRWKGLEGRSVAGVQWIGGPGDEPERFPTSVPRHPAPAAGRAGPSSPRGPAARTP